MGNRRNFAHISGKGSPLHTQIVAGMALSEAKQAIKRGGCLTQKERSEIARGGKATDGQEEHLAGCEGCSGYIAVLKEKLGQVERR